MLLKICIPSTAVALPKVYILVHFWQRVSAMLKHRFSDRMSVVLSKSDVCESKFAVRECARMDIPEQWHPCRYWKSSTCKKHVSGCFLHAPCSFRTDMDVRESEQKRGYVSKVGYFFGIPHQHRCWSKPPPSAAVMKVICIYKLIKNSTGASIPKNAKQIYAWFFRGSLEAVLVMFHLLVFLLQWM